MTLTELSKKTASKSACRYRVSAIAIDKRGRVLGSASNRPRFAKLSGGKHAELAVLRKVNVEKVRTIILARINPAGELLPIDPCKTCAKVLNKLGIKIKTIEEI